MNRPLGVIATRQIIDLHIGEFFPPIPKRNFDYSAIDANTYDADYDEERGFHSNSPHCAGATEIDAINDLLDQIEVEAPWFCLTCKRTTIPGELDADGYVDSEHMCHSCVKARNERLNAELLEEGAE